MWQCCLGGDESVDIQWGTKALQGHLQSGQTNSWDVVCLAECQLKWLLAT